MSNFKEQKQGAFMVMSRNGIEQSTTINHQAWVPEDTNLFGKEDGYGKRISIEEIKIGEEILAYDVKADKFEYKKVLNVHIKHEVPAYLLYCKGRTDSSEIETHEAAATFPVLVTDKGWVNLIDLKAGDRIKSFDWLAFGASGPAESRALKNKELIVFGIKQTGNLKTMYSLELDDALSYCIGGLSLWTNGGMELGNESLYVNAEKKSSKHEYRIGVPGIGGCGLFQYLRNSECAIKELDEIWGGSHLMSRQVGTGELRPTLVRERIYHQRLEMCELSYLHNGENDRVNLAYGQEILLENGVWKRSMDLRAGDILESGTGNFTVVESLQLEGDYGIETFDFLSLMMEGDNNSNYCIGLHHELCLRGFHFDEDDQV